MKTVVNTGLQPPTNPNEWAILADNILYTSQIPQKPDGTRLTGTMEAQATLTLQNLKQTVEAAGGSLSDVAQITIYIASRDVFDEMNEVYRHFFSEPYPNRTAIITELVRPGALIELTACVHIESQ